MSNTMESRILPLITLSQWIIQQAGADWAGGIPGKFPVGRCSKNIHYLSIDIKTCEWKILFTLGV